MQQQQQQQQSRGQVNDDENCNPDNNAPYEVGASIGGVYDDLVAPSSKQSQQQQEQYQVTEEESNEMFSSSESFITRFGTSMRDRARRLLMSTSQDRHTQDNVGVAVGFPVEQGSTPPHGKSERTMKGGDSAAEADEKDETDTPAKRRRQRHEAELRGEAEEGESAAGTARDSSLVGKALSKIGLRGSLGSARALKTSDDDDDDDDDDIESLERGHAGQGKSVEAGPDPLRGTIVRGIQEKGMKLWINLTAMPAGYGSKEEGEEDGEDDGRTDAETGDDEEEENDDGEEKASERDQLTPGGSKEVELSPSASKEKRKKKKRKVEKSHNARVREGNRFAVRQLFDRGIKGNDGIGSMHKLDEGVLLGLLYLVLAMIGEMYPGGPVYQVGVAVLLLYLLCYHDESSLVVPLKLQKKLNGNTSGKKVPLSDLPYVRRFRDGFMAAKKYEGTLSGMVFKLGDRGIGYYTDVAMGVTDEEAYAMLTSRAAPSTPGGDTGVEMDEVEMFLDGDDDDDPSSPLHASSLRKRREGASLNGLETPSPGEKGKKIGFSPSLSAPIVDGGRRWAKSGILHSPNGTAWWGLASIVLISICADLDFLSSSEGRTREGLRPYL